MSQAIKTNFSILNNTITKDLAKLDREELVSALRDIEDIARRAGVRVEISFTRVLES